MNLKTVVAFLLLSSFQMSCTFSSKDSAAQAEFVQLTDRGLKEFREGKYDDAQKSFERTLQISANSGVAMNNLGSVYNAKKQFKLGLEICRKAIQVDPGLQIAKNNFEFAKSQFEKMDAELKAQLQKLKKSDADDVSRIEIGLEYYRSGDYQAAVDVWSGVGANSKLYAKAQNNIATGLIPLGKFDQAGAALSIALKLVPNDPGFLANQKWLNDEKTKSH